MASNTRDIQQKKAFNEIVKRGPTNRLATMQRLVESLTDDKAPNSRDRRPRWTTHLRTEEAPSLVSKQNSNAGSAVLHRNDHTNKTIVTESTTMAHEMITTGETNTEEKGNTKSTDRSCDIDCSKDLPVDDTVSLISDKRTDQSEKTHSLTTTSKSSNNEILPVLTDTSSASQPTIQPTNHLRTEEAPSFESKYNSAAGAAARDSNDPENKWVSKTVRSNDGDIKRSATTHRRPDAQDQTGRKNLTELKLMTAEVTPTDGANISNELDMGNKPTDKSFDTTTGSSNGNNKDDDDDFVFARPDDFDEDEDEDFELPPRIDRHRITRLQGDACNERQEENVANSSYHQADGSISSCPKPKLGFDNNDEDEEHVAISTNVKKSAASANRKKPMSVQSASTTTSRRYLSRRCKEVTKTYSNMNGDLSVESVGRSPALNDSNDGDDKNNKENNVRQQASTTTTEIAAKGNNRRKADTSLGDEHPIPGGIEMNAMQDRSSISTTPGTIDDEELNAYITSLIGPDYMSIINQLKNILSKKKEEEKAAAEKEKKKAATKTGKRSKAKEEKAATKTAEEERLFSICEEMQRKIYKEFKELRKAEVFSERKVRKENCLLKVDAQLFELGVYTTAPKSSETNLKSNQHENYMRRELKFRTDLSACCDSWLHPSNSSKERFILEGLSNDFEESAKPRTKYLAKLAMLNVYKKNCKKSKNLPETHERVKDAYRITGKVSDEELQLRLDILGGFDLADIANGK